MKIADVRLEQPTFGNTRTWVVIECPYCGKQHRHGASRLTDDPQKFLGHRAAHCDKDIDGDGYLLVEQQ